MKNLIISILFLLALTAWFSFYGEPTYEFQPPKGRAVLEGNSGTPIPIEGAEGKVNAFNLSQLETQEVQQETEEQQKPPITVSVEQPTTENNHLWEMFLCGMCAGVLIAEIVILLAVTVCWLKNRK